MSRYYGCVVFYAKGDADLLIDSTAIRYAELKTTIVVGEDTYLSVLLCYYVDLQAYNLLFHTQAKSTTNKSSLWNMKVPKTKTIKCVKAFC